MPCTKRKSLGWQLVVALALCGFIATVVECKSKVRPNDTTVVTPQEKAVLLKNAFQQLLKLKKVPGSPSHVPPPPPQYMLELYDKYRRGDVTLKGGGKGNTVRSILAIRGNMNGEQMLLFNLSGISSQEDLLQGELHYYKRRKVKWPDHASAPEYRMRFVGTHVGSDKVTVTPLATVPVSRRSRGWQVHDVTQILKDCREPIAGMRSNLMGIKFQGLNSNVKFVSLPPNKFLNMNSQPFLIVFSNDQEANTIENLESHMTEFLGPSNEAALSAVGPKNSVGKDNVQDTAYSEKVHGDDDDTNSLKRWYSHQPKDGSPRAARSVLDNELPDNSIYSNFIPQTSPNVLQSRNRPKQKQDGIIPYPHMMTFGTQRKNGQKNRRRQNRRLPKTWQRQPDVHQGPRHENDASVDTAAGEEDDASYCRKRKLVVDFADIGWGEWIISPKSFEAHYCSGACSFPLMKNMKPSNHATIQSIVNAIGIHPNVPAPCCVADSMSSVTLLYFDEDRNVVLKNYPSMTVESCACR